MEIVMPSAELTLPSKVLATKYFKLMRLADTNDIIMRIIYRASAESILSELKRRNVVIA